MAHPVSDKGFTVLEMISAVVMIAVLAVIYFLMVGSYKDRRMNELAAKCLRQAKEAQEEFFAKEYRYFDADISANNGEELLTVPGHTKPEVKVPAGVVLSLKAVGDEKKAFVGHAFYMGSTVLHRYDSRQGKMTTVPRVQDGTG